MHQPICDCSFGVIWINKNNCKTLLFIFAFLSSRGYWVEKSINTFGFKNINLSMLEVWIDSEIQIYNNITIKRNIIEAEECDWGRPPPLAHTTVSELHWLPVNERINFKLLSITFKALHGLSPLYLQELITIYTPVKLLRSVNKGLLVVPKYNLKSYGMRAFLVMAPLLWNIYQRILEL